MTDKVQAQKSLDFCCSELNKYQTLSRSGLSREELITIDRIMIRLKGRIKNLRTALYGN
ncbi:hypothetical protein [Acinetobacter pittii]|uniref:Uncharacterized protein n=1 Tax=Acinetobacter pittii TaxID=48296 RepID=A0AAE9MBV2_ACIPI|nr:hypothetical protein [Acinetobacter pittii]MCU4644329.1 hypothetical protein [Acinetobacter pittii]USU95849.1 hypothetical protein MWH18_06210 [Acinetobacter pittii]